MLGRTLVEASSSRIRVTGVTSDAKNAISWRTSFSKISKSLFVRLGMKRPFFVRNNDAEVDGIDGGAKPNPTFLSFEGRSPLREGSVRTQRGD